MSQFKNNPNFNLYYSDTDSIYIDKELDSNLISNNELGKLKLEKVLSRFIGLGPKFYGGIDLESGLCFSKLKGYSSSLSIEQLESLLIKDNNLLLNQIKWFRDYSNASITITPTVYKASLTENKRFLVFDDTSKLVGTKSISLSYRHL